MNSLRILGTLVLLATACDVAGTASDTSRDGTPEVAGFETGATEGIEAGDATRGPVASLSVAPAGVEPVPTGIGHWVTVANPDHPLVPRAHQLPDGSVEKPRVYVSELRVRWTPVTDRL